MAFVITVMAKEYAKAFYKSAEWMACKTSYIKRVGGLCEDCMERGIYTPGKVVHHKQHITPENINNPEITLNHANLRLVCQECHAEEHSSKQTLDYYFDRDGNIVRKENRNERR